MAAVPVPGLPHYYRVVARYGFMDEVDLGEEFMQSVIKHVGSKLVVAAQREIADNSMRSLLDAKKKLKRLEEEEGHEVEGEGGAPEQAATDSASSALDLLYRANDQVQRV